MDIGRCLERNRKIRRKLGNNDNGGFQSSRTSPEEIERLKMWQKGRGNTGRGGF